MAQFMLSEEIAAPVPIVWGYVSDPETMGRWMPGIDWMRSRDGAPLGPGSQIVFKARGAERTSEVVTCVPDRELTLRSTQGAVTATYRYRLEPEGAGTRATLHAHCEARGAMRLVMPLIGLAIRKVDGKQLLALREAVRSAET